MNRPRFFDDKQRLWRQVIAAWVILFMAVMLFVAIALSLSIVIASREAVIILAFTITTPVIFGVHAYLRLNDYRLRKTGVEVFKQSSQPKVIDFKIAKDRYLIDSTNTSEDEQGQLILLGNFHELPVRAA